MSPKKKKKKKKGLHCAGYAHSLGRKLKVKGALANRATGDAGLVLEALKGPLGSGGVAARQVVRRTQTGMLASDFIALSRASALSLSLSSCMPCSEA